MALAWNCPRPLRDDGLRDLVDLVGIEPTTSSMPWKRAPSCATGPRSSGDLLSGTNVEKSIPLNSRLPFLQSQTPRCDIFNEAHPSEFTTWTPHELSFASNYCCVPSRVRDRSRRTEPTRCASTCFLLLGQSTQYLARTVATNLAISASEPWAK